MNNKFFSLLFTLLIGFSCLNADEQSIVSNDTYGFASYEGFQPVVCQNTHYGYGYASVGVGPVLLIPNVGIGYRQRHGQFGWDTGLNFSTVGYAHQASAHLAGLCYLNSLRQDSYYVGVGVLGGVGFTNHGENGGAVSGDLIFGKELASHNGNRQFIEMHAAVPSVLIAKRSAFIYAPAVTLKYGMSF